MNHDIADDLEAIKAALRDRPSPTITGGQLYSLMEAAAPELNFREVVGILRGPGALSQFVQSFLSDILDRIGNQGGDLLYRVDGRDAGQVPDELPNLWKNFVSPSSPRHLIVDRISNRLISRATAASVGDNEVEIPKATDDELNHIRADFEASLPPPDAAELAKNVAPGAPFAEWIAALRQCLPEAVRKWGVYRRDRLHDLFERRVAELDLPEQLKAKVLFQIRASQHAAVERQRESKLVSTATPRTDRVASIRDTHDNAVEEARSLTHCAVNLLSYDELRALKLPLGVVLDAFRSQV